MESTVVEDRLDIRADVILRHCACTLDDYRPDGKSRKVGNETHSPREEPDRDEYAERNERASAAAASAQRQWSQVLFMRRAR